ncbi:MAG: BlaI/MecI/CopY family transcriptional regulator [Lawsonibacter sp.]|nr:BlaI/MecI/CopY family transcriptional regulator [Lawsonibacter sp.]
MGEQILTGSEWYVMDALWERGSMTVMELVAALQARVGWSKSTTITTLRRMEGKGLLRAEAAGRGRRYVPLVERRPAQAQETRSFLDKVYQGSVGLMVSALVQDQALSRTEIDELYKILRQAEEESV